MADDEFESESILNFNEQNIENTMNKLIKQMIFHFQKFENVMLIQYIIVK